MLKSLKGISTSVLRRNAGETSDQYIVGLDVGTEYVKALIAKVSDDDIEVVGVGRAHQQVADMQAGAIADISAVVQNCDQALAQAEKRAGLSARNVVIGIAGELVKGTTVTVSYTREKPDSPLTATEMEKIIALVQERAAAKAKQRLMIDMGGKEIEIRLVNSAIVTLEIDGYTVTNPIGFQGKEVIVQLYTAFAPMIHIAALERVANELDLDVLAVAAEPFAVSRSIIGNDPNQNKNVVLMDIGGGTTDIAVVQEGGLQGTEMFGIGGRAFTRAIERELSLDFEDAERAKLSVSDKSVPESERQQYAAILQKTTDVWISGVELALSQFTHLDTIPHQIMLCGGGASLPTVTQSLKKQPWYHDLPFSKRPIIDYIDPRSLYKIQDTTGIIEDHTYITAMGLLRVGLDTQQQVQDGDSSSGIRQKMDRILRI